MRPILQSESSECALACLAMISAAHKLALDIETLRRRFSVSLKGATLMQLMSHASALNFSSRALRVDLEELGQLQLPCILHWNLNHFVVLKHVGRRHVRILDPAIGERSLPLDQVSRHFTGVALELAPTAQFETAQPSPRISLRALTGRTLGLKRSLARIFALASVLQIFAITTPLLNQWVVDEAIATYDQDLLGVLILGFGLLLIVQTAVGLARSWMAMALSMSLSLQWSSNLFRHLIRLPMAYFEQRHLGDIVSRFGALGTIQKTLTSSLLEALLDGVMSVATFGMMVLYSPRMSAVTLGAVALYAGLRWMAYQPFRDAAAERLVTGAQEQTYFLESLRAILPLKSFGREHERCARWQNLLVEVQNRDVRTAKMSARFGAANIFLFGLENLTVLWLGANLVLQSTQVIFTIGMLFAFISYKSQFTNRMSTLIDYVVELKILSLHAQRLADVALSEPEVDGHPHHSLSHLQPCIQLNNLSFRYGEGEPWVLKNVSLSFKPGESVAIIGPSGSGKTTLLKVLLGLLVPDEGEVLYGGVAVKQLGLRNYRRVIGTGMQEDVLLAGSIADNVSFFDTDPDHFRIERCAQWAAVHEDIISMPMGYQTLVGDMGSSLSGGQKQRVLLARALYKDPKVLALDEATSHLDIWNEQRVNRALAELPLTRIIVAHRPETIASAQRVVHLRDGQVTEMPTPY